jgi:hypothetical protein
MATGRCGGYNDVMFHATTFTDRDRAEYKAVFKALGLLVGSIPILTGGSMMKQPGKILVLLCVLGLALAQGQADSNQWPWTDAVPPAGTKIGYVRPDATPLGIKPVQGKTYEDLVPDTTDIAEMSKLAINVLTCGNNRRQDYEQYFSVYMGNPLRMAHNFSDWCTPKYIEALALLRVVTGSTFMTQVDQAWQDVVLKSIGPDGLYYFPLQGKPWYGKELWWAHAIACTNGTLFTVAKADPSRLKDLDPYAMGGANSLVEESGIRQFAHPQSNGRIMKVMAIYGMRDGNPRWKEMMTQMVARSDELAIKKGDYAYFPAYLFEPNAKFDPKDPRAGMPAGTEGGEINGRFIRACAIAHKLTGDKKALELARLLTNFMRCHDGNYWGPKGEFAGDHHFHAHTNYLIGMLEYADAAKDKELLDFCRQSFEWAKSPAAGFGPVTGFAPELADVNYATSEGCAVGDMEVLACNLSAFGAGDYYEDAERWARNYFSEIQLTRAKADDLVRYGRTLQPKRPLYNECTDHVADRNLGSFSSWALGNEWWRGPQENLLMQCCTGNCTRALWFLWRDILDFKDGELRVNMLLNRASAWADVYSFIPYQGRVEIKVHQPCKNVLVHAPEWIATGSNEITAQVSGQPRPFNWQARYLNLGAVKPGEQIVIQGPISERTVKEKMGLVTYTLLVRGNTVVSIDPPGRICPLFQREYLRDSEPRWRKVQRFVADKQINY